MRFISPVLLLLLTLFAFNVTAGEIKVNMPKTIKANNEELVLNGFGIREKYMIDLFYGGLYLKEKSSDANGIVKANEPMAIKIQVISDVITGKRLEEGMRTEFFRTTKGNIAPYKSRIEQLVKTFSEDVEVGDTFDLIYTPEKGLKIYKNNILKTEVAGHDFKQVLFSIWLGDDPADKGLKKGMLG